MELENQRVVQVITGSEILKHVEPNDFVISMRSFQGGLEWCKYAGSVSSAYIGLIPIKWVIPNFFAYLFKCSPYIQALQSTSNLVRDGQALRFENFSQVSLLKIPNDEQQKIAQFLDHETAKIDTLIEKQQQLIELLKEKRQAIISHAVTKGLNPNAPMKDSGVEWLGDVPEGWEIVPLKHLADIKYGIGEPPKYTEEGVALIRATNIRSGRISNINLVFVNPIDIPSNRIVWLEDGDIIVVRSGAGTGDSSIIPKEYEGSIAGFDMVVKPLKCLPAFLAHALLSNYVRDNQIDLEKTRAAQPHLNAEELGACFVLVPLENEQNEIVNFLNKKTVQFDALISKAQQAIELMQERRTALISAAVTGKIDVREWNAPNA